MKSFVAIVLASMLILMTSTAVAEEQVLFDFLQRVMDQTVLPGASELLTNDIAYGETSHVSYTIKQAVYDGQSAALLVEMKAKDDETLLIGPYWMLDDQISWYMHDPKAQAAAGSRTFTDYAAEMGYTRVVEASLYLDFSLDDVYSSTVDWNNNVLTELYTFTTNGDELLLPIEYWASDRTSQEFQAAQDTITLKTDATSLWQVSSDETFDAPDYGIHIDGVTMTGTPVQSYWTISYTVTDVEKANSFGWGCIPVDMNKRYLPNGSLGASSWTLPEENGQQIVLSGAIAAMETPPTKLMIFLSNFDDSKLNNYFPITLK